VPLWRSTNATLIVPPTAELSRSVPLDFESGTTSYFEENKMSLRVLALAAPQFQEGAVGARALSSADPASLFNACRLAAQRADQGVGPWGDSNWAVPRRQRRENVLLLHSLAEGLQELLPRLQTLRPNLVLIGSMTICLPGAIACAAFIKAHLGDEVCIVLGGRHPSESIYRGRSGLVEHHPSSPLRLMAEEAIEKVFDIVVSGDGEYILPAIGELVAQLEREHRPAAWARDRLAECVQAPGNWIAGTTRGGHIATVSGTAGAIDYSLLPAPCSLFGVRTSFDVFGGRPTAHVFSDGGRGCIYDCNFCSERRSVTGVPAQLESSADRLFRQLAGAVEVIAEDYPGVGASAFVEDSILLTGSPMLLEQLVDRLRRANLDLEFGGQLTIDRILARPQLVAELRAVGLKYLFVGLETSAPTAIGGMSKDVGRKTAPWLARAETMLELLADLDVKCGVAVLFGLGEAHEQRLALIEQVRQWRTTYGGPAPISMNWAVQHPLLGQDGGTGYTYTDWAIPQGPFLEAFRDFGEASVRYPLAGQAPPSLAEVLEVRDAIAELPLPRKGAPVPKPVSALPLPATTSLPLVGAPN
jgi:B12-binding domain/radical SAM domain protein